MRLELRVVTDDGGEGREVQHQLGILMVKIFEELLLVEETLDCLFFGHLALQVGDSLLVHLDNLSEVLLVDGQHLHRLGLLLR